MMLRPFLYLCLTACLLSFSEAKISPALSSSLTKSAQANVIVSFDGGNFQVLNEIESNQFDSKTAKRNALKSALEKQAEKSQTNVRNYLTTNSLTFKSFWVSNQIYIPHATLDVIESVSAFPEVEEIHEEILVPMHKPLDSIPADNDKRDRKEPVWGIERIQAPEAWKITKGEGVVVSHIDTGVRYTHEALRHNFRGAEYGWFDPYEGEPMPVDDDGHGTHIMGTIAGTLHIGIAPNATWIACRGCNLTHCTEANLITCGQWVICPWKPNGTRLFQALTSCSWGIGTGDSWYERVTEAWVTAGIVPIFALGNYGPNCSTTSSPGDYKSVIGVGSTHMEDRISNFSSIGPTPDGRIKPEVSAPGENILSAFPEADDAYGIKRGTSMATPHVAGVVALLLSLSPNLTFQEVRQALMNGADTNLMSQNLTCDGHPDNSFPNNHYGAGRINALKVVQAAKESTLILDR